MFIIAAGEAEVVNLSFVFEPIKSRTNLQTGTKFG